MRTATRFQTPPTRLWRFVQFPLTRIVIATVFLIAAVVPLQGLATLMHVNVNPVSLPLAVVAVLVLVTIIALMATYIAYVRLIERRPVTELGTPGAASEFVVGFVIGGFLFCLLMLILWLAGVATIGIGPGWTAATLALLSALELAVMQEIFFRAIVFRIAEQSLGTWIALTLSVVVFGAAHGASPGASWISEVTIGVEAGALLAAVYVYTRRLWMVFGVNAAWNFVEDGVFGVSTAGHKDNGLLVSQFHGPAILTGGTAGPEVTVVALLICLTAVIVFVLLARRKGHLVVHFWHRAPAEASALKGAH